MKEIIETIEVIRYECDKGHVTNSTFCYRCREAELRFKRKELSLKNNYRVPEKFCLICKHFEAKYFECRRTSEIFDAEPQGLCDNWKERE